MHCTRRLILLLAALISVPFSASAELIIGTKDGFGAQLYGFGRLDIIYQDAHLSHPQFPEFAPLLADDAKKDDDISIHPRLTRLGVKSWSGPLLMGIEVDGVIEIDFQNGGSESREVPRMRLGFGRIQWKGVSLLAGQTWQLVSQLYPGANADSMMWNSGNTGDRSPQLRLGYTVPVGDGGAFEIAAALMMPNTVDKADRDANGFADGADAAIGSYQARVAFSMPLWTKQPLKVAVGGHLGKEQFKTADGADKKLTAWGVFAELDVPIWKQVGIKGEFFMGQGLSDVRGGVKNLLNTDGDEPKTLGFWGELWVKPVPYIDIRGGYGQDSPEKAANGIESNAVIWALVGWRPVPQFRIQAEYHRWSTDHRVAENAEIETTNRFNMHFTYFF